MMVSRWSHLRIPSYRKPSGCNSWSSCRLPSHTSELRDYPTPIGNSFGIYRKVRLWRQLSLETPMVGHLAESCLLLLFLDMGIASPALVVVVW
jgi:hypothetical protein